MASMLEQLLVQVQSLDRQTIVLGLVALPFVVIFLNVLRQLIIPQSKTAPPVVFHYIPWFGSAAGYGDEPAKFFSQCREKYGDIFTFILFGRKVTACMSAKGNNFVLGGQSRIFNAEDAYTHLTTPVFGTDVVYDVPNEVFMEQKRFVKVGLSTENLKSYVGMIEDEVESYLRHDSKFSGFQKNKLNEWGSFDVVDALSELIILCASRTLQGKEVRADLDKSFAQLYNDLDGGFTPINFLFPNLPLPSYWRRDRAQKKMSDFYIGIMNKRRSGESVDFEEGDMLEALMKQKYRNGKPIPDHQIAHMMIALLMAGQHTSSATSSWSLLHLASRPDIQKELYEEQVKFFGSPDGHLRSMTYDELRELPVLDSVIRETLRLHPPLHSILRGVRDDVPVPRTFAAPRDAGEDSIYVIPKGHYVLASPLISQTDPAVWKDANEWDPARWNDSEGVAAMANRLYVDEAGEKVDFGFGAVSKGTDSPYQPFGAGRHRCIGEQFAYLQLGVVLATLVRNLEFKIEKVPAHNYHTMITMPKHPRQISYRRRKLD
ncbi:cytochrome P450 [Flagelloscypha sp. PMI_526]|nr:cytochrome P450 [Flagelloscypha sp. PMI_526]